MARAALGALVLLVAVAAGDGAALAQSCRQLETRLAALATGGSAQARSYDRAIAEQRREMERARGQASRAGCARGLLSGSSRACAGIRASLSRMEANLRTLQDRRAGMGGATDTRRERARIEAALRGQGCRGSQPRERTARASEPARSAAPASPAGAGLAGNFRTMCVRTCDGYYFPVSYGVSAAAFERDGRACAAMCPGTDVALHYHRVPDGTPENMISVATGEPYSEMQTAFLHRRTDASRPQGCACGAAQAGFELLGQGAGAGAGFSTLGGTEAPPVPRTRPDPAADPETLANAEGGLGADELRRIAAPRKPPATPQGPDDGEDGVRRVRVVGPTFFPDPEAAAAPPVPDPAPAP